MEMSREKCPVKVWTDWTSHICGRPVKRDGKCGIHARQADNDKQRKDDGHRRAERREELRVYLTDLCEDLAKRGIVAVPELGSFHDEPTNRITIHNPGDLAGLLKSVDR